MSLCRTSSCTSQTSVFSSRHFDKFWSTSVICWIQLYSRVRVTAQNRCCCFNWQAAPKHFLCLISWKLKAEDKCKQHWVHSPSSRRFGQICSESMLHCVWLKATELIAYKSGLLLWDHTLKTLGHQQCWGRQSILLDVTLEGSPV